MEEKLISILFSLLRYEVCGGEALSEEEAAYANANREALYGLSKSHDVAHLVGHALSGQGLYDAADPIFRKFEKQQILAIYRYEQSAFELQQICEVLERAKIDHLPLKGAIIRDLYPEPWMRTSCDLDILIREEQLAQTIDALTQELGYEAQSTRNYHDISLFSPGGIHLELHFNIMENMENIDRMLSKVWEHAAPMAGGHRYAQSPAYFMFHHIAHMAYHFVNGGCGIKPFLDLCVLQEKMAYDSVQLRQFLDVCELGSFYDSVLCLKDVWFAGKASDSLCAKMQTYLLTGGVYGSLENKAASRQKKGGKLGYALSRLLLPYDTLKQYYPILQKHKWLFPIMQVRRWGRVLFCGRMKASVKELSASGKVTKDEAKQMQNFLSDLGL